MKKHLTAIILLAAMLMAGCTRDEDSARRVQPDPSEMRGPGRVEPGQILVKLKSELGEDPMTLAASFPDLQITSVRRLFPGPEKFEERKREMGLTRWYVVCFDQSVPVTRAASDFIAAGGVEEINYVHEVQLMDEPETWPFDDPRLPDQWHYMNFGTSMNQEEGSDINLFPAWNITTGNPDVIVAVIDSGVDVDHEDLAYNMWVNEAELNGQPGVDDDRNGYVDDIYGFNFTSDNYSGTITAEDHGTHVAGTIAAVNNNGIGVAGIAGGDYAKGKQGVRIMACQTGPGAAYIASAFTYAADNGAVITQNSWGCDPSYTAIFQAIDYFNRYAGQDNGVQVGPMDGGLCIFAAGNSSSSTQDVFPADYEGVMAVASIGADYEIAYYSNYGDWVDITAPGGDAAKRQQILSTIPNNKYGEMQGTSMACPHASGVAALIVSAFGGEGFTRENLWDIMVSGVRDIYEYNPKYEGMLGAGLIDAELCLTSYGPNPPEPVTDLEAVSSTGGSITLQWTVPEDSDSYKPSKFNLFYSTSSLADLNPDSPGSGVSTMEVPTGMVDRFETISATVSGLSANTEYHFRVQALDNLNNASELSNEVTYSTTGNTPPVISTDDETDVTLKVYENVTMNFTISDPDGDAVTYEFVPGSEAATATDADNVVTVFIDGLDAPKTDREATYTAQLIVSDGTAETVQEIHYTIIPNNEPEISTAPADLSLGELSEVTVVDLSSVFTDVDGETLRYEVSTSAQNSILTTSISGTKLEITAHGYGQETLTVTAYDAAGTSASCSFEVVVRDGSRPADFYPNPVTDYLYIRTGETATGASVEVKASNGGTVLSQSGLTITPFEPVKIDMTSLAGGMYKVTLTYTANGSNQTITTDIAKL